MAYHYGVREEDEKRKDPRGRLETNDVERDQRKCGVKGVGGTRDTKLNLILLTRCVRVENLTLG